MTKVMTKADLKRLEEIRAELFQLRSRLESLRNASAVSAVNYSQTGAGGGTGDPVSRAVASADEVACEINELQYEGYKILCGIIDYHTKEVIALYYLHGFRSWSDVSRALNKHRTYAGRLYRNFKETLDNASTKSYNCYS